MLLTVDCGNTRTTLVWIDPTTVPPVESGVAWPGMKETQPFFVSVPNAALVDGIDDAWEAAVDEHPEWKGRAVESAIIGSVNPRAAEQVETWISGGLKERQRFRTELLRIGEELAIPIANETRSPRQVGHDRLLNALAASHRYPNQAAVIVDIGTAITFDIVSADGAYLGGVISPGIRMSLEALHDRTAMLPLLPSPTERPNAIGVDTASAIHAGTYYGFAGLITGVLTGIKQQLGEQPIVLGTGGDLGFLTDALPPDTFAAHHPFLTHEGLLLTWMEEQAGDHAELEDE